MKYLLLILPLLLFSCSKEDIIENKTITFNTIEVYQTRAGLDGLTDLYVIEGGEVLLHQTSSESTFGSPEITLDYGQHNLVFIASKSTEPSISNGIFSCNKVLDTYSKTLSINISSSSANTQSITLERCIYGITIIPKDVYKYSDIEIIIKDHCLSYYNNYGINSNEYHRVFDTTDLIGKTDALGFTVYGFLQQGEDRIDLVINFRNENGQVEVSREVEDVPVEINKKTVLTGYFFDSSLSPTLTINTSWNTGQTIDYNSL